MSAPNPRTNLLQDTLTAALLGATSLVIVRWSGWLQTLGFESPPYAAPIEAWALRASLVALAIDLILMAWRPAFRRTGLVLAGVLFSFAIYEIHYGLLHVDPRQLDWVMAGRDGRWHFAGWEFFRREPWQFPPSRIAGMLTPVGTSIANTDTPALPSFLFKPWDRWLPEEFQYFGMWFFLCALLQGVFAALLFADMRAPWPYRLLAVALVVWATKSPSRDHASRAAAAWICLAALWLYFRPPFPRQARAPEARAVAPPPPPLWAWLAILFVAASTSPYVTVMALPVCAAALLRSWWPDGTATLLGTALRFLVVLVFVVATFALSGNFAVRTPEQLTQGPLGLWSMDLLAPINPAGVRGFLPEWPIQSGQYEGLHYLGAPVLALAVLAAALLAWRRPSPQTRKAMVPLGLACAFLTLAALSPRLTVAGREVLHLPEILYLPLKPFRASGRFFLPVSLAITYLILRSIAARLPGALATALLALALVLQFGEGAFHSRQLRNTRGYRATDPGAEHLRVDEWRPIVAGHTKLYLRPRSAWNERRCPWAILAARLGVAIDFGQAGRFDNETFHRAHQNEGFQRDTVYVVPPSYVATAESQDGMVCRAVGAYSACTLRPQNDGSPESAVGNRQ